MYSQLVVESRDHLVSKRRLEVEDKNKGLVSVLLLSKNVGLGLVVTK